MTEPSRWNHALCDTCWSRREPDRQPVRLLSPVREVCCICRAVHRSGIYVRFDPDLCRVKGDHEADEMAWWKGWDAD